MSEQTKLNVPAEIMVYTDNSAFKETISNNWDKG